MPEITFKPGNKTIEVPIGTGLFEAAQKAGVEIQSPCGQKGTCGKCKVKITKGTVDSDSLGLLDRQEIDRGYVLACKTKFTDSPVTIEIPRIAGKEQGKFVEDLEETGLIKPELLPAKEDYDPPVVKWYLHVDAPAPGDGLSDLDRLSRCIHKEKDRKEILYSLPAVQKSAATLRADNGRVTVTVVPGPQRFHIIDIQGGDCTGNLYGIAVDVGTTTVAVRLVSLAQAGIIAAAGDYNDQVTCGLDVISRINYARDETRLQELRSRVLATIGRLIENIAANHNLRPQQIYSAVIAGNTTMIHLLLGLNPEYIRIEPYTPTLLEVPGMTAGEIGIGIYPYAPVYISPAVGSYVGGDITAGLLCTGLAADSEEINMFIDIGTNGELVIGSSEFLMTCACSAGPAFEGGGISCGMRASRGAVDHVEINPGTGKAQARTIGDVPPKGICGSGMISLLAGLFRTGWLDNAGKLDRSRPSGAVIVEGRRAKYIVVPADECDDGKEVIISEHDIENIIRAKAAIYAACALMLKQVDLGFEDLGNIFIGGGFGRFLDIEKAITIGLIPDLPREKYHYVGNSSLMGAYMVLVSQKHRRRQLDLARRMTYIELNTDPGYMDQYTGALFLPHTEVSLFPTVKKIPPATEDSFR